MKSPLMKFIPGERTATPLRVRDIKGLKGGTLWEICDIINPKVTPYFIIEIAISGYLSEWSVITDLDEFAWVVYYASGTPAGVYAPLKSNLLTTGDQAALVEFVRKWSEEADG